MNICLLSRLVNSGFLCTGLLAQLAGQTNVTDHIVMIGDAGQDDVVVFDGGMGHLIKQKDLKLASLDRQQCDKFFLVGAYANVEQPLIVESLHLEFITAGATVITTNSFAATPWALTSIDKEADLEMLLQVRHYRCLIF